MKENCVCARMRVSLTTVGHVVLSGGLSCSPPPESRVWRVRSGPRIARSKQKKPHEFSVWLERRSDGERREKNERKMDQWEKVRDDRSHLAAWGRWEAAGGRTKGSLTPFPFLSRQPLHVYPPHHGDWGPVRPACTAPLVWCQILEGCLCFPGFFEGGEAEGVSAGASGLQGRALAAASNPPVGSLWRGKQKTKQNKIKYCDCAGKKRGKTNTD